MSEFFGSLWWFVLTLGVLVTFHEFGHYWVARRCGVKVLRFSVGFGRALWSRTARDGTEYQIAMIPLGGYVKMLDDRENEVAPAERASAFNQQPPLKRIAIIAAGPIANLLLCIALLWAAFVIGVPGYPPTIGKTTGLAAEAGLRHLLPEPGQQARAVAAAHRGRQRDPVHAAREARARAGGRGSALAGPQLRRHRTPAPRPPPRGRRGAQGGG